MLFAFVTERWVEGLHARSRRWLEAAPHASAVQLAFHGMQSELQEMLRDNPESFATYAAKCSEAKNVVLGIESLGFEMHPVVTAVGIKTNRNVARTKLRGTLIKVIYHVDPETMYNELPPYERPPDRSGGPGPAPGAAAPRDSDGVHDGGGDAPGEVASLGGGDHGQDRGPVIDVTADGIIDRLWRAAALHHISSSCSVREDGVEPPIYSLGPHLSQSDADCFSSLRSLINPTAGVQRVPMTTGTFEFVNDDGLEPDNDELDARLRDAPDLGYIQNRLHVFAVVHTHAHSKHLPSSAPRLRPDSFCVRLIRIADASVEGHRINAHLEEPDNNVNIGVFSAGLLSRSDLKGMRAWEYDGALTYSFGLSMPAELQEAYAELVPKLCSKQVGESGCTPVVLMDGGDESFHKRLTMQRLESYGLVREVGQDPSSTTWALSEHGVEKLTIRAPLRLKGAALRSNPFMDPLTATTFELLDRLETDRWTCHVRPRRDRGRHPKPADDVAVRVPKTYIVGEAKDFWVTHDQETHQVWYLRALVLADAHEKGVPHFHSDRFYEELVTGTSKRRKPAVAKFEFDTDPAPEMKVHKVRKGPERGPEIDRRDSGGSSSEGGRSRTRSPSSASLFGMSMPTNSVQEDVEEENDQDNPDKPPPNPPPLSASRLSASTEVWKTFKFTEVRSGGEPSGRECTCYSAAHVEAGSSTRCTRTISFSAGGGRELTERKMKWWCTHAFDPSIDSRKKHQGLPKHPADVGTLEDLDKWQPPPEHVLARAARENRRV